MVIKKKRELIIFDFDGTIVDSKTVYYRAINKYLREFGFSRKKVNSVIELGFSMSGFLKELGFSRIYIWYIKKKIMKDVMNHVNEIKKCRDVNHIKNIKTGTINSLSEFETIIFFILIFLI
jgi:phosphoglycolate phosphatase-like HAD superfamily hydrolase